MKHSVISLALLTCASQALFAQEGALEQDAAVEITERDSFLALLDEQTTIATRTRMNADYVPGMVTVMHGDTLEARGARTVWEALSLVPGMEMAIEKTGRRKVLIRGLGNTWASGNVKILLNDVSMNSAEYGLADPVFNIPVEQVDRIEVIRGPGSAIYGEYAYMGVINIVTRADEGRVFAFGGSFDTRGAGTTLAFSSPESPLQASLNLAAWSSGGAHVTAEEDLLWAAGFGAFSYAPGSVNNDLDAGTAVFKLGYQGFSLTAQWSEDGIGDNYGVSYWLPHDEGQIVERNRHRTVDMRQELPLSETLTAGIQLGWKDVERKRSDAFVGFSGPGQEILLDSYHLETSNRLGADFAYRGWDKHTFLLAMETGELRVDESWRRDWDVVVVPAGTKRSVHAVTLQDEYRHSDLFTLTAGLRYDEYSDVGISRSPRVAGVWRLSERHIVKAQYAEAFRPPTLYEVANADYRGNDVPSPATIRTSELGYIFKGATAETRLTGFYSQLDDLVVFLTNEGFGNGSATAWGLELEQSWQLSPAWALDGNASYVDTRDEETGDPFPGAAQWLANAGASYRRGTFLGTLQAHHVGGYEREAQDPRGELAGYTTVDLTGTFARVLAPELQLRLGVKNLFDADVRFPAPIDVQSVGVPVPTYAEDFPQAGRSWWAQVSYAF